MTNAIDTISKTEHYLTSPRTHEEFARALNRQIDPDQFARIMI